MRKRQKTDTKTNDKNGQFREEKLQMPINK